MSLEPKTFFSSTPNCLECHHTIMSSKFYCKEMEVRTLGWEDPLEKKNGNPLQYSCLRHPLDQGAWRAAVHEGHKEVDTAE